MRELTYTEALRETLRQVMQEDPSVFMIGEDIGVYGGAFGVSAGLIDEFGPERIIDTPISEAGITGACIGAALTGMRPVGEIQFMDFITLAMEQLVLQAAAIAKGGELFILDMGEPVKIVDLAKKMIRLYGKEDEVEIVFTGLRPGEKLYEELLIDEAECRTRYESILVAEPTEYPIDRLRSDIARLLDDEDKIATLRRIVEEFRPEEGGA
jgi:hypothetical protein